MSKDATKPATKPLATKPLATKPLTEHLTDSESDTSVQNEIETRQFTVAVQQGQRRRVM